MRSVLVEDEDEMNAIEYAIVSDLEVKVVKLLQKAWMSFEKVSKEKKEKDKETPIKHNVSNLKRAPRTTGSMKETEDSSHHTDTESTTHMTKGSSHHTDIESTTHMKKDSSHHIESTTQSTMTMDMEISMHGSIHGCLHWR